MALDHLAKQLVMRFFSIVLLLSVALLFLMIGPYVLELIGQRCIEFFMGVFGRPIISREWYLYVSILFLFILTYKVSKQVWLNRELQKILRRSTLHQFSDHDLRIEFLVAPGERPLACTYGFLNPKIFLTTRLFESCTPEELRAVILHEYHHKLQKDPLKIMMLRVIASTFWFLPVLHKMATSYETVKELMADKYVMNRMGTGLHLGSVLYKVLGDYGNKSSHLVGLGSGAVALRIEQIISGGSKGVSLPNRAYYVTIFILFTFFLFLWSCF